MQSNKKTKGLIIFVLLVGVIGTVSSFLWFSKSDSWKEEVLLHDGKIIVVNRWQNYGGRHEIGQSPSIKDHSVTFSLPTSGKTITWKDEYSQDVGGANFNVLALHILNDISYIVASPTACLEYNKWGRPNPPYVIFKHDGKEWRRIPFSDLPKEFKEINLVINSYVHAKKLPPVQLVTTDMVKKLNKSLKQPEFKTIIRSPLEKAHEGCVEHIRTETHKWLSIDWFSDAPNHDACIKVCEREKVDPQKCPCGRFFKGDK